MPEPDPTTEGLADQLHDMLTPPIETYPNPIETAIRQHNRKYPFIESKTVLAILESDVGATPERFLERVLKELKYKDTIKIMHFYDLREEGLPFNFAKFSEQLAEYLPKCEHLYVRYMLITNFRIESITIKNLSLISPQLQDEEWEVKCPNLVELDMQNHTPPVKNFQRALINCPRIETYFSHKFWNREPLPAMYLPNCTNFTFRRGDCTESLKLYLPRVEEVTLDACYDLKRVELLTEGHPDHAEWNKAPGSELSKFHLSLTNSIVSKGARRYMQDTGRVTNPSVFDRDDEYDEFETIEYEDYDEFEIIEYEDYDEYDSDDHSENDAEDYSEDDSDDDTDDDYEDGSLDDTEDDSDDDDGGASKCSQLITVGEMQARPTETFTESDSDESALEILWKILWILMKA